MTMNPRDYDLDELKGIAEEYGDRPGVGGNGRNDAGDAPGRADDVLDSNQYRELMLLQNAAGGLEKPYLETMPEAYAAELLTFEWLEFLLSRTGYKRTLETLRYYRSIDWLTEETESRLEEYLRTLDEPADAEPGPLDRSDHVLSLVYVARLASMVD